jgi:hypothetical protein
MFEDKVEAYMNEAPFRYSTLGEAPGLAHKIRLGQQYFPGTITLAHYENP